MERNVGRKRSLKRGEVGRLVLGLSRLGEASRVLGTTTSERCRGGLLGRLKLWGPRCPEARFIGVREAFVSLSHVSYGARGGGRLSHSDSLFWSLVSFV